MKFYIAPLACIVALALSSTAFAEIYESKDAQGNPVFTDTPTTVSKEVELPTTNTADAPPNIPEAPREAPKAAPASTSKAQGEGDVVIIGDSRDERLEEDIAEHRRHEVLGAEKRHEVGDGEVGIRELPEKVPSEHPEAHPKAHPHVDAHRR